jgi:ribonuclease J
VGDVGHGVLRDRRVLSQEGVIVVIVVVDAHTGEVLSDPEIITRGWVYAPEAEALLGEARQEVVKALEEGADEGVPELDVVRRRVRQAVGRFVNERTRRRPMILPVVIEA